MEHQKQRAQKSPLHSFKLEQMREFDIENVSDLKEKAQIIFSKYIRLRDTDEWGRGHCISSGRELQYGTEEAQAGHFYKAELYPELAFNEDNVHLQSRTDNYYKDGNLPEYKPNLLRKIGVERYADLAISAGASKTQVWKPDLSFYINIIKSYSLKVKELLLLKN